MKLTRKNCQFGVRHRSPLQTMIVTLASPSAAALPPSLVLRRVGLPPAARGSATSCTCPDIFELADGNFAVVGTDRTGEMRDLLPSDAGVASYEKVVIITRETLLAAVNDLT
jgi:hypothetical protein